MSMERQRSLRTSQRTEGLRISLRYLVFRYGDFWLHFRFFPLFFYCPSTVSFVVAAPHSRITLLKVFLNLQVP
jgi:hypothetical protein